MNYKYHRTNTERRLASKKTWFARHIERKFIRSLSLPEALRNGGPQTDCALLTKFLCEGNLHIVATLLKYGSSVTTGDEEDFSETPFFHALRLSQTKIAKQILINTGDDTKYLNLSVTTLGRMEGYNALHTAVAMGNKEIIRILLKFNHKLINSRDKDGYTPLHLAWYFWINDQRSEEMEEIIDLILTAHDRDIHNSTTSKNLSHFHIACTRGNIDVVRGFLDRGVEDINAKIDLSEKHLGGCTAVYVAVKYNYKDVVQILLQHGAKVNTFCKVEKKTALFEAAIWNHSKCYALIRNMVLTGKTDAQAWETNRQDQLAIIEMIANCNGKLGIENYWWYSIIHLCWDYNNYSSFWDRTCKANCDLDNICHDVSLKYVDRLVKKDFYARRNKIILKLIDREIDLSEMDIAGKTIFHYLVAENRRGNVRLMQSLIRRNANVTVSAEINGENTILDVAIKHGQVNMVRMLLKNKIQWCDPNGKFISSALISALMFYTWGPKEYEEIVNLFIENGTNVNDADVHRDSPLHVATVLCDAKIIRKLLDVGADINGLNTYGYTVFMNLVWARLPTLIGDVDAIDDRQKAVYQALQHHVIKLMEIGFYLNEFVVKDCRVITLHWKLEFDERFRSECIKEIKELKAIKVSPDFRLFDILIRDTNKIVRCVGNVALKKIMSDVAKEKRFPIYATLLQRHYKKCTERLPVFKKAEKLLSGIMNRILPTECIGLILENFEMEDLNFLISTQSPTN